MFIPGIKQFVENKLEGILLEKINEMEVKIVLSKDKLSSIVPFKKLSNTKAWKLTSELVRKQSNGICYTCNGFFPFEKLVAGHFIEKIGNAATYFDLDNLRAQCMWNCNRMRHGQKDIYALKLEKEKGYGIIQELHKRASKSKQWMKSELKELAEERQKMLNEIE